MKRIADRGYTDVVLNRHVEKGAILEEEYKKDNKELTEERIRYLVDERKLYIYVEEAETNVEAEAVKEEAETEESNEEEATKNTAKSKTKNTKKIMKNN